MRIMHTPLYTMHRKGTTNITVRDLLLECVAILVEALLWLGCVYAATKLQAGKTGAVAPFVWLVLMVWGIVFLFVATRIFPNNACSRTARRDEVVACAMKTAVAFGVLALAVFTERNALQLLSCLFFCIALTLERLILNSWFIRYCLRNGEHGVFIAGEEAAWQQKALQQNTYGLKLLRLETPASQQQEGQTAELLNAFLAAHPETGSVYCDTSFLPAKELEAVAHTCCEQGLTLHLLPLPHQSLPQSVESECRGTVEVLLPACLPLRSIANRMIKRLTDIVLSLIVLLTVFPPFALIAYICIKRQSHGPVFTTRHLCGMNGKKFLSLTFRTRHYEEAPSFFDGTGDPGYFPFGKFLKHSRLELLPQFLCVLWGSMTIVGSQTMLPEHYDNYSKEMRQLFASGCHLKAGITCFHFPSQGKNSTQADVWYCRNWGFWLDMRIMLQRLGTLLSKSKAKSIHYI